jgi:hypothetical protein
MRRRRARPGRHRVLQRGDDGVADVCARGGAARPAGCALRSRGRTSAPSSRRARRCALHGPQASRSAAEKRDCLCLRCSVLRCFSIGAQAWRAHGVEYQYVRSDNIEGVDRKPGPDASRACSTASTPPCGTPRRTRSCRRRTARPRPGARRCVSGAPGRRRRARSEPHPLRRSSCTLSSGLVEWGANASAASHACAHAGTCSWAWACARTPARPLWPALRAWCRRRCPARCLSAAPQSLCAATAAEPAPARRAST